MDERATFLKAIIAEPDEDTHRLVYADWLEEHGEAARAEFIRVQVELAKDPRNKYGCRQCTSSAVRNPAFSEEQCCCRYKPLYPREKDLLAAHEAEWRKAGKCFWCDGHGTTLGCAGDRENPQCTKCHRTGDCGGLLRTPTIGDVIATFDDPSRKWLHAVTFRRGFPARVECRHADAVDLKDDGWHPTQWLQSVVRYHPIEEVVATDVPPWAEAEFPDYPDHKRTYGWWDWDNGEPGYAIPPLFELMWAEWPGCRMEDEQGRWLIWDHREDAIDAHAEALAEFGRRS